MESPFRDTNGKGVRKFSYTICVTEEAKGIEVCNYFLYHCYFIININSNDLQVPLHIIVCYTVLKQFQGN